MRDSLPPDLVQLRSTLPIRALVLGLFPFYIVYRNNYTILVRNSQAEIHRKTEMSTRYKIEKTEPLSLKGQNETKIGAL